jgi:hypothetical protein
VKCQSKDYSNISTLISSSVPFVILGLQWDLRSIPASLGVVKLVVANQPSTAAWKACGTLAPSSQGRACGTEHREEKRLAGSNPFQKALRLVMRDSGVISSNFRQFGGIEQQFSGLVG